MSTKQPKFIVLDVKWAEKVVALLNRECDDD